MLEDGFPASAVVGEVASVMQARFTISDGYVYVYLRIKARYSLMHLAFPAISQNTAAQCSWLCAY